MKTMKTLPFAIALLAVAAVLRTLPHAANVTPFFAISILVGFLLGPKRAVLAGVLSAAAMLLGDLVIGLHWTMAFVYAGIAAASLIGAYAAPTVLDQNSWLGRALGAFLTSGLASTTFFVISNIGVWLVGGLYPQTLAGLGACFAMAIPFFTNSLASDLFFGTSFILVASWVLLTQAQGARATLKVSHGR